MSSKFADYICLYIKYIMAQRYGKGDLDQSKIQTKLYLELALALKKEWQRYLSNLQTQQDQEKQMNKNKHKVKQLRENLRTRIDIQQARKEEDSLKLQKKNLEALKFQYQTLMKLQGNEMVPQNTVKNMHSLNLNNRVRELRLENKQLWQKLRDRQKQILKLHSQMYAKKASDDSVNISDVEQYRRSMDKELEELSAKKSQAEDQLKKQMASVDNSFNKLKTVVEKKKMLLQQKLKQLQKLKSRIQKQENIRASIQKLKQRQRAKSRLNAKKQRLSQKRRSLNINNDSLNNSVSQDDTLQLISSQNLTNQPISLALPSNIKVARVFKSIGVGTTFYYNEQDYF